MDFSGGWFLSKITEGKVVYTYVTFLTYSVILFFSIVHTIFVAALVFSLAVAMALLHSAFKMCQKLITYGKIKKKKSLTVPSRLLITIKCSYRNLFESNLFNLLFCLISFVLLFFVVCICVCFCIVHIFIFHCMFVQW